MMPFVSMACFWSHRTFRASLASRESPGSEKLYGLSFASTYKIASEVRLENSMARVWMA